MDDYLRDCFDEHFEQVVLELPAKVRDLIDEVSVIIDDYPSREMMRRLGLRCRQSLCGLYTGVPITARSVYDSGQIPAVIHLFREGIISRSYDRTGTLTFEELRKQIRLTLLHEFGHHHGLEERELEELGY